jgi:hypothetical protein
MKKDYFLSFLLITLLSTATFAQKLNTDLFKKMKARSIGPAVMSGRITRLMPFGKILISFMLLLHRVAFGKAKTVVQNGNLFLMICHCKILGR